MRLDIALRGAMLRRTFLSGAVAGFGVKALTAAAQAQDHVPRIGLLWHAAGPEQEALYMGAFRQGLSDYGYIEGRNITVEHRFPSEIPERFRDMATELASKNMDILIGAGPNSALALQKTTKTTPIIFIAAFDPVGRGLVSSIPHPTENITGLEFPDLIQKRLEVIKEAVPDVKISKIMINTDTAGAHQYIDRVKSEASYLGLKIEPLEIRGVANLEAAFAGVQQDGYICVAANPDPLFVAERKRIAALALQQRLPSIFHNELYVRDGALMSYGTSIPDIFRRAGSFVDRILKGTKISDIPVEQPSKYRVVVNLKTADQLGIKISDGVLARADEYVD
ncbi:ABC transporter substrate-binding protein [Methylobacterium longum]|uniref:ABC transporter substrate-binding protein n=1 Tax=Methylobacterium longum TaxID=767694 RepID=A0ABT8AKG0_9HYPH|nr:ABC transporter substrate-binding protein [Methylobacterium longum]MDN3570259.1 ABC transporter substrate-binding protein [Methylobacterium longum]